MREGRAEAFASMFRTADIRGRVSEAELNVESVAVIAQAFARFLLRRSVHEVVLGYDNRKLSPAFRDAAAAVLVRAGLRVYDIGLSLSPVAYFAQHRLRAPGVMMITASHNPDGWSGLKLGSGYSSTLGKAELQELYALTQEAAPPAVGGGVHERVDVRDAYISNILDRVSIAPGSAPRVVLDAGNGGAGVFAYELFQRLGCMVFLLNCDPDDGYPHYFPNPSDVKAAKRLREMVLHPYIKADLGLSFDGDGDRLGVMDSEGRLIWADRVLMLLAAEVLRERPGAPILFDVKATQALPDAIRAMGGRPVMCRTGHSGIKAAMAELDAPLAGERSGHIFYGGDIYWGFDDALFAAAKLVALLSREGKDIQALLAKHPEYLTSPEIKAACRDERLDEIQAELAAEFAAEYGEAVDRTDGARVRFSDGWGLVRASSNLPELVLVFEGETEAALRRIYDLFREKLAKHPEVSQSWENDPFDGRSS